MNLVLLRRVMEDRRRSLIGWAVGLAGIVAFSMIFYPAVRQIDGLEEMMRQMPESVRVVSGLSEGESLASASGYLNARLFALTLPLLLVVFAIGLAAALLAVEESDGRLATLLAMPVRRRSVFAVRVAALLILPTAMAVVGGAMTLALAPVVGMRGVPVAGLLVATIASGMMATVHGAVALAVGGISGRKAPAIAVAAVVATAGYLLYGMGQVVDGVRGPSHLSPWYWYLGTRPMNDGASWMGLALPLGVSLVLVLVGGLVFLRRDIA